MCDVFLLADSSSSCSTLIGSKLCAWVWLTCVSKYLVDIKFVFCNESQIYSCSDDWRHSARSWRCCQGHDNACDVIYSDCEPISDASERQIGHVRLVWNHKQRPSKHFWFSFLFLLCVFNLLTSFPCYDVNPLIGLLWCKFSVLTSYTGVLAINVLTSSCMAHAHAH